MKYIKKSVEVDAITFDELVEYGRTHGANIVDGMPWSFEWEGCRVTHENDECFYITTPITPSEQEDCVMSPSYILIKEIGGEIYVCHIRKFKKDYEPLPDLPQSATDILRSKIQPIANIIVAYEKQLMNFDDVGVEICNLFDKEVTQLEVAKKRNEIAEKLFKLLFEGNGTGHKEVEELRREWETLL